MPVDVVVVDIAIILPLYVSIYNKKRVAEATPVEVFPLVGLSHDIVYTENSVVLV